MSRARDNANLGAQAGSGLDASDITSGALGASVTGGAGLAVSTATTTALNAKAPLASPTFTGTTTVSGDLVPSTPLSHRNMIINGAMQVSQRGTSQTVTSSAYAQAPDRFKLGLRACGTFVASQSTEAPAGFVNSYKVDCTVADASLDANSYLMLSTKIEGQDLVHLKKGTASTEAFTISFYVRSSITGTYVFEVQDEDNSRHIAQTYAISSADTWERKELTFAGDTSDPLTYDNSLSFELTWSLARGTDYTSGTLATSWADKVNGTEAGGLTVNLGSSTSNDFHLTGVQLELGSNATPFEHRSYGEELRRCQRYYQRYGSPKTFVTTASLGFHDATIWGWCLPLDGDDCATTHPLPVEMRTTPTASITEAHIELSNSITNFNSGNTLQAQGCSSSHLSLHFDTDEGLNTVNIIAWTFQSSAGYYDLSAEL